MNLNEFNDHLNQLPEETQHRVTSSVTRLIISSREFTTAMFHKCAIWAVLSLVIGIVCFMNSFTAGVISLIVSFSIAHIGSLHIREHSIILSILQMMEMIMLLRSIDLTDDEINDVLLDLIPVKNEMHAKAVIMTAFANVSPVEA